MGLRSKLKNKAKNFVRMVIDRYVAEDIPSPEPPPPQKESVPVSTDASSSTVVPKEEPAQKIEKEPLVPDAKPEKELIRAEDSEPSVKEVVREEPDVPEEKEIEQVVEKEPIPAEDVEEESAVDVALKEHEVQPTLAPLSEEEKKEQAAAKHIKKTKKGLLKKLKEAQGQLSLRDLHDYSEKRFFMGHQKFSLLMEELVEEDLVEYSYEDGMVSLGDQAEEYLRT